MLAMAIFFGLCALAGIGGFFQAIKDNNAIRAIAFLLFAMIAGMMALGMATFEQAKSGY